MTTDPPFLAACRGLPRPYTPIWIMRQAGRYLPEYRKLRDRVDFLTLTKTPELAAEATLQPIRRFDLDAAILFSDIMTPLEGMGVALEFDPGPRIADPIRSQAQVDALRVPKPEESVPYVLETIRILRSALPKSVPLIGFSGGSFTLFCYLVEGGGSKSFLEAKTLLFSSPEVADRLLDKLASMSILYLRAQAAAGAQALMIFDSWVGLLDPEAFRRFALPPTMKILSSLQDLSLPLIYFPNQGATLLSDVRDSGANVVGIDWRIPLSEARRALGSEICLQGNLDPAALFAPPKELERQVDRVVEEAGTHPGHIFNLGHGIAPNTDPDAVRRLVDYVHETTSRG